MFNNISPWLDGKSEQLFPSLKSNIETDIAIVGGGISGITSLYYILKNTNMKVVLFEKDLIAHGATGHNAGLVTGVIERPTRELVKEYGKELAMNALHEINDSWKLLDDIIDVLGDLKLFELKEAVGFTDIDSTIGRLEDSYLENSYKLDSYKIFISDTAEINKIPEQYRNLYQIVPHYKVLEILHTQDKNYITAAISNQRIAGLNTSDLCYSLIRHLSKRFPDRFEVYEKTAISRVELIEEGAILLSDNNHVQAKKVLLCTNGYNTGLTIYDKTTNTEITDLQDKINGVVGYMVGYFTESIDAFSTVFFNTTEKYKDSPYFYVQKMPLIGRPFISFGSPERWLAKGETYNVNEEFPEQAIQTYIDFISEEFGETKTKFDYKWHGLMGYLKSRVRWIGESKQNKNLLYNLGCNGIGILPAIMGSEKISNMLNGEEIKPSIFDPS